jgi:biopolymer transport protein ExbD
VRRGLLAAAPLADVVLSLVLFFVINTSFVLQPGVRLTLPSAEFASGVPYGAIVVTISQEGLIFFNDQRMPLEGLEQAFRRSVYENPDAKLIIEADGRVQHRKLIDLYNMAMAAGIREVALATRLPPSPPPEL